ncbi:MAG TPA: HAMP domain-containing sensor histidine kinase [Terriglobia bacterium]|nr:HAMP domain-containing sensor histidine kinase [Terriglobia bacterium]
MKFSPRKPAFSVGVVCALAAILMVLAVLQVRWTGQVSRADAARMQTNLHTAVMRFRRDFYLQLLRICWAFQSPTDGLTQKTLKFYADRYDDWMSASARPDMIAALFVWDRESNRLLLLDPAEGRFKPTPWPPGLAALRRNLESSAQLTDSSSFVRGPSWVLDEESHALFHPFSRVNSSQPDANVAPLKGGLIVELDMKFIWRTLLPELNARYFRGPNGSDYRVSIISGNTPREAFYESAPAPSANLVLTGDVVENFIGGTGSDFAAQPAARELAEDKKTARLEGDQGTDATRAPVLQPTRRYLPLISIIDGGSAWRLVVRHRSGSVEAAVDSLRRRNLTVSFSILLLLAASMALIVVSAQRAHRFATLQMDFVAGVSHELRTPLAVICSAAENLADGVVAVPEQVKNYGGLIRDEGRRLSEMVGQVLGFAAGQAGQRAYHQQPVDMVEVAESTLASILPALESSQVVVEKHFERGIPPVLGDPSALGRCLQNLISNAIKYGGEDHWIGFRAETTRTRHGDEVSVIVEDHGRGIDSADLPHIFEPFYRGKNGGAAHIHGTGLGLSLAKDMAEAMGGRLSVKTTPGKGSQFILHLPALAVAKCETPQTVS